MSTFLSNTLRRPRRLSDAPLFGIAQGAIPQRNTLESMRSEMRGATNAAQRSHNKADYDVNILVPVFRETGETVCGFARAGTD